MFLRLIRRARRGPLVDGAPLLRLGQEGHRRRRLQRVLPDAHDGRGVRGHDRL